MSEQAEFKQPPAIAEDLDFVCNMNAYAEKTPPRVGLKMFRRAMFRIMANVLFILLFLLFGYVIFGIIDYVFVPFPLGTFSKVLAFVLLASLFFNFYSRIQSFPTNLQISRKGIRFAWHQKEVVRSPIIAWDSIVLVSASGGKDTDWTSGAVIKLVFDREPFGISQLFRLVAQTYLLWTSAFPFHSGRFGIDVNLVSLEFPLGALTLEADRFRLIAALQARCPAGTLSGEFKQLLEADNAPTFTQFWLDDMKSFRRQHIDDLQTAQTLQDGRYEIIGKLGTGGQAKIYQARDQSQSCLVAIKELVLPVSAGVNVRNRAFGNVKNEALLLCSLDHPGIVKLLDNFVEDHRAYLVLEHIPGQTLRRQVQERGPFDVERTLQFANEICELLNYLHGQSPPIVHRDLTPDNLMLTDDGHVKLLDFNVAQQLESNTTKTVVGKHNYMAPEQFRGKPTTQSDLYSLGCTLYYLLVGADPTPLSCLKASDKIAVPAAVDELISRLTKLELDLRCQSASEAQQLVNAFRRSIH